MAVNIGPKIGVDGEAEYRRQINQIIQQSKTLESQMKLVASQFTSATTAEEKNAKTAAVLTKQIDTQRERVKLLAEQTGKEGASMRELRGECGGTEGAIRGTEGRAGEIRGGD